MQGVLQVQFMKIGYARVSTQDQNLDLQLKALRKTGCRKIFREKVSGVMRPRPEFQRMLDQIREGDTDYRLEARPVGAFYSRPSQHRGND